MKIKDRTLIERRYMSMKNAMTSWIPGWQDIQRFIDPSRGFFYDSIPNFGKTFDHKTQLDSVPGRAARTLAAGMMSGLTSPARPWFKISVQNQNLLAIEEVKEWLDDVEQAILGIFSKSNIYGVLYSIYEELGEFATACMFLGEDFKTVIHSRNFTIGEYFLGQDESGRVNSFGRLYNMTVGQLVEEFGIENVSPNVANQWRMNQIDGFIRVCHLIEPNDDRLPDRSDFKNKPIRSIQWELGSSPDLCLRYSGYDEFPVLAPRWQTRTTADIYGTGPGHRSLGNVKMLMKMQKDKLIALDKVVDPPVQVDSSIQDGQESTVPGGISRSSSTAPNAGARPLYQIAPDFNAIQNAIGEVQQSIEKDFYADLFLMLDQIDAGKMTATEVMERHQEKLAQVGPVIERLESELLDPLIERTYSIGLRTGVIPPPPNVPGFGGADLKIEYISLLAQAQKMAGISAIQNTLSVAGEMAAVFPDIVDAIDADEAITRIADMNGVPPKIIRSATEIAKIRQQKAQQMAQQQQMAMIPAAADTAKTLSDTELNKGSALDALTGGKSEKVAA